MCLLFGCSSDPVLLAGPPAQQGHPGGQRGSSPHPQPVGICRPHPAWAPPTQHRGASVLGPLTAAAPSEVNETFPSRPQAGPGTVGPCSEGRSARGQGRRRGLCAPALRPACSLWPRKGRAATVGTAHPALAGETASGQPHVLSPGHLDTWNGQAKVSWGCCLAAPCLWATAPAAEQTFETGNKNPG